MDSFKFLLVLSLAVVFLARGSFSAATAGCSVPAGTAPGKYIIQLLPNTSEIIASMGDNKSPKAIIDKLQSFTDAATAVMNKTLTLCPFCPKFPSCRYYWALNQLWCDNMNSAIAGTLCSLFNQVGSIVKAPDNLPVPALPGGNPATAPNCTGDVVENGRTLTWGQKKIGVTSVWAQGINGSGIRTANIDTGVRGTHVELRDNRCPGENWMDPFGTSVNDPTDGHGHGSHTMATVAGKNVGVAPGSCWMACRGCSATECDWEKIIACGQWMGCPNKNNNCSTRADVLNNSYGGGIGHTVLDNMLAYLKSMGVTYFFSSANDGPGCFTVKSPADHNYTKYSYLSVGSTQCNDEISPFSSRGPSQMAEYMNELGVQIVGPGSQIKSAWFNNDTAYNTIDGTSQSSPHVTGVAALVLQAKRTLTPDQVYAVLTSTTYKGTEFNAANSQCTSSRTPANANNVYGFGRVDAEKAVASIL